MAKSDTMKSCSLLGKRLRLILGYKIRFARIGTELCQQSFFSEKVILTEYLHYFVYSGSKCTTASSCFIQSH